MDGLNSFLRYPLEELPFIFIVLVLAFTVHEFAHAYAAYKFGDPTAKQLGRVTLNPRVHLDVLGTILIFIAGFGWAKPVPVNRGRFKYPRLMGIIVSAVGPLSNLLLAFIGVLIVHIIMAAGLLDGASKGVADAIALFLTRLVELNLVLFIFNLIPLPPLDGYRIIEDLAPTHIRLKMAKNEQWGIFIFLMLIFIPPLSRVTIQPLFAIGNDILSGMSRFISIFI
ncbi:site-2 protease family protein [Paenibacillus hemerocallicola]|uniref:Site-2 protease family protein n=1 Tax=Paenibacillus hemerocallicola TaxID=1172614 RepID=A0A5C4T4Z7_9BACL|nr:site-2 protease family protein [Paenibacillus hemerocallicola]TNJ64108.1 site-2 protease family protein [Paenibacillus hemerocallicola]